MMRFADVGDFSKYLAQPSLDKALTSPGASRAVVATGTAILASLPFDR